MRGIFVIQGEMVQEVGYRPYLQELSINYNVDVIARNELNRNIVSIEVSGAREDIRNFHNFLTQRAGNSHYINKPGSAKVDVISGLTLAKGKLRDIVILKQGNKLIFEQLSKGIRYQLDTIKYQKNIFSYQKKISENIKKLPMGLAREIKKFASAT